MLTIPAAVAQLERSVARERQTEASPSPSATGSTTGRRRSPASSFSPRESLSNAGCRRRRSPGNWGLTAEPTQLWAARGDTLELRRVERSRPGDGKTNMDEEISDGVCNYATNSLLGPLEPVYIIAGGILLLGAVTAVFTGHADHMLTALKHKSKMVRIPALITITTLALTIVLEVVGSASASTLNWLQSETGRCVQSPELFTASAALSSLLLATLVFWAAAKFPPRDADATQKKALRARALRLQSLFIPISTLLVGFWLGALTANLYVLYWIPIAAAAVVYAVENWKPRTQTPPPEPIDT